MDECLIIANEIMQKVNCVSKENGVPIDVLLNIGINMFLKKANTEI